MGSCMIDIEIIKEFYPLIFKGTLQTLQIALFSCCIGAIIGIITGIIIAGENRFLKSIIAIYVTIIRGTPMLIQITATFYTLKFAGFGITAFWSAILSIGLNSGAYVSQIIFSGIKSIGKGQMEAAQTLGFNARQTMQLIILPQAARSMLPALGNEFITLVKDSSLASIIGVYELSQQGNDIISQTYNAPTVFLAVGFIYLMLTSLIGYAVSRLEKKLSIPC